MAQYDLSKLGLIPQPATLAVTGGEFAVPKRVRLCFSAESVLEKQATDYFSCNGFSVGNDGYPVTFKLIPCKRPPEAARELPDSYGKEAYVMQIDQEGAICSASFDNGLFYAFQTLKQLFASEKIPSLIIEDAPECAYRGFMADLGRYFFPVEWLKQLIDVISAYKYNALHLHLTEDQGWRIQIDKYPLLAQKGSKRSHTNFSPIPRGGYYTKDEIRALVAYAHERMVCVVPEIDVPGHSRAALACYPQLGCFGRKLPVATHWGVKHDVLCPSKPYTMEFLHGVLEEIIQLFPDKYVHLGGDEVPVTRWKLCPDCQKAMKDNGFTEEGQLQTLLISRLTESLEAKDKVVICWAEAGGSLPNGVVAQCYGGGADLQGATVQSIKTDASTWVLNSRSDAYYLDLPYGNINLEDAYRSPAIQAQNVKLLGAEAALWTEFVPTIRRAVYTSFPRTQAIADRCWNDLSADYQSFLLRMEANLPYLRSLGIRLPSKKLYLPNATTAFLQRTWFARRKLYWQGLHNLIDNAYVKRKYGNKK